MKNVMVLPVWLLPFHASRLLFVTKTMAFERFIRPASSTGVLARSLSISSHQQMTRLQQTTNNAGDRSLTPNRRYALIHAKDSIRLLNRGETSSESLLRTIHIVHDDGVVVMQTYRIAAASPLFRTYPCQHMAWM